MNKIKVLLLSAVLTMLFAMPVFAQEVTDPTKVIKEETFNAEMELLEKDFHNMEVYRSTNYIKYLDGVIYNLEETVRIKREIITNYIYLSQFNPAFRDKIPQAQKDLDEAQAWVNAYKEYKKVVQGNQKIRYNY